MTTQCSADSAVDGPPGEQSLCPFGVRFVADVALPISRSRWKSEFPTFNVLSSIDFASCVNLKLCSRGSFLTSASSE